MTEYPAGISMPMAGGKITDTPSDQIGGNSPKAVTALDNIVSTESALSPVTGPASTHSTPTEPGEGSTPGEKPA